MRFVGISPVKLFELRSSEVRLGKEEKVAGMLPERWLEFRRIEFRDEIPENSCGISPERLLLLKSSWVKWERRERS